MSDEFERFGDYTLTIPVAGAAAAVGSLLPDRVGGGMLGTWGLRTTRAVLVGEPALLFLQRATGASRPGERDGSEWRPFEDDNGVSGHSFIGALPFLAAATMTDRWYFKVPLVVASALPAWQRVDSGAHYYSQAVAGWWLAYRSMSSVAPVFETSPGPFTATPLVLPDGVLFAFVWKL